MKKRLSRLLSALLVGILSPSSADADSRIRFADFYVGETFQAGIGMRPDLKLSDKIQGLTGQTVEILGFMDGILPRDGMHFVLIKEPSFLCPFHAVSFDWAGFIPIFLNKATDYMDGPVRVVGRLDVGAKTDEMGLLSYVRIYNASIQRATK